MVLGERAHLRQPTVAEQLQNSPDLTPCDFFLWGYIKSKVHSTVPTLLADLEARIQNEFDNLSQHLIDRAINNYERRLQRCIVVGGYSAEQTYADVQNWFPTRP